MESYGECSTNDTIVEDMETELCSNEESSNTQGADVTHTLKSGSPACRPTCTRRRCPWKRSRPGFSGA